MKASITEKKSIDDTLHHKGPSHGVYAHIDPVCSMTVNAESAAGTYEYNGQSYYFCSTHCLTKFRENPELFLKKTSEQTASRPVGNQREHQNPPELQSLRLTPVQCIRKCVRKVLAPALSAAWRWSH